MTPHSTKPGLDDRARRAALRRDLLARRQALPARASLDAALSQALARTLAALRPDCIGIYRAIRGEFDPLPALRVAGATRLALPVVDRESRTMRFVAWHPDDALHPGPYGIDEPLDRSREVEPDLLLVPCVGFNPHGVRLGYGAGYYDRYLARHPGVRTIGLAFEACRVDTLRAHSHDHPLDLVLTELASYERASRPMRQIRPMQQP